MPKQARKRTNERRFQDFAIPREGQPKRGSGIVGTKGGPRVNRIDAQIGTALKIKKRSTGR